MYKLLVLGCFAVLSAAITSSALAHPGRTNSSGCHNDRRTGDYHCHGGSGGSSSSGSGGYSSPSTSSGSPSSGSSGSYVHPSNRPSNVVATPDGACPQQVGDYNAMTIDAVNLRTGPSTDSNIITEIPFGTRLKIHSWTTADNGRDWGWLTTSDGQEGWASRAFISCLE
jgi:uncharacterized protein YgiM (DUF1202 family)